MGIRIIKTAAAAIAANYAAVYFQLEPPLAAGVLAILGVEATRLKGLKSVMIRFVASVLGLFLASFIFTVLGFHYWVVAIYILATFPVLSRFQLKDGILTSAVIVFHLFDYGKVTTAIIGNEIMLLFVGLGCATVINLLYMPKEEKGLAAARRSLEESLSAIFCEMALTLRNPGYEWDGGELLKAHEMIEQGERLAVRSRENRLWGSDSYWPTYFEMRRQQLDCIGIMLAELALVYEKLPQGESIARLLEQLSGDLKSEVYQGQIERRVLELMRLFRAMELPKTRDEFEMRAALLTLMQEIERYLSIAKRLKKKAAAGAKEARAEAKS